MKKQQIKSWLIARADNHQQNLKILIAGFALFAIGAGGVVSSNHLMTSSLLAELVALISLILIGVGIILALFGYICLSVLRLFRFFTDD